MKRDTAASQGQKDDRRSGGFPKISFSKAESKVKVLDNRPVMKVPDEAPRYPRRDDRTTSGASTAQTGEKKRLRDDVKPMFQRDIGFATPTKDGTAKK